MKAKAIPALLLAAVLLALALSGCGLFGTPPAPAAWNSALFTFAPVDSDLREPMRRAFADCARVENRQPAHRGPKDGAPGKLLWSAKRGAELDTILAQLAAVPHWYKPRVRHHVDIALREQDLSCLRFLDAEGKPLYEQSRRFEPVCVGEDGHSKSLFAFFPIHDERFAPPPSVKKCD